MNKAKTKHPKPNNFFHSRRFFSVEDILLIVRRRFHIATCTPLYACQPFAAT